MGLIQHERRGEESRDDWETPPDFFALVNHQFRFDVDVAANEKNSLCGACFIDERMDALKKDWSLYGRTAWCNPPYALWGKFMERAHEMTFRGVTTVLLVPPRSDSLAFHLYSRNAAEIFFLQGRVQFLLDGQRSMRLDKKTGKMVPSGNGAASALFVFRPRFISANYGTPRIVYWDWKEESNWKRHETIGDVK